MRQIPLAVPAALAVLAACGGSRPPETIPAPPAAAAAPAAHPTAPGARADAVVTGRPIIPDTWSLTGKGVPQSGHRAMVVSGHPVASHVGIEIIKQGGNAVDAAVAVGFALAVARSRSIAEEAERLSLFPASAKQFLVDGHAPAPGTKFHQPDLAHTLQLIADSGPGVFYTGQVADLIVAEMQRGHGLISKDDLQRYTPKWRTPVEITYRGYAIYSMPPASSGGVTLGEILNIMEGYDTLPPFGSPGYVHLEVEAMRRAFMDRNRWLGDPDFVDMPLERLLSKSYAAELRAQILPDHATPTPPVTTSGNEGTEKTH